MPETKLAQLSLRIEALEKENRELQKTKERLEGTRKHLLEIIDNTPAPIYLKDKDGKYLLINRRYEHLARVTQEQIAGKIDLDIFPEEVATLFRVQDEEVMEKNSTLEFEETITLPDGEFTFITLKFPVHDENGEIYAVGGFCTDITERKKIEKEKENLIGRLQTALDEVKTLRGIIPICSFCKKMRDDKGYWNRVETYIAERTDADFSHALCPDCVREHYPELHDER